MSSKAYRATRVNEVNWEQIARGKEGLGVTVGIDVGKFDLCGGLSLGRWAVRASLAGQEPLGDPDVGGPPEAGQGGPEAGGGFGALGNVWRGLTTGAGGQRDRSPARRYQGVP